MHIILYYASYFFEGVTFFFCNGWHFFSSKGVIFCNGCHFFLHRCHFFAHQCINVDYRHSPMNVIKINVIKLQSFKRVSKCLFRICVFIFKAFGCNKYFFPFDTCIKALLEGFSNSIFILIARSGIYMADSTFKDSIFNILYNSFSAVREVSAKSHHWHRSAGIKFHCAILFLK